MTVRCRVGGNWGGGWAGGGCFAQKKLKKIFTWFPPCHPPYLLTLSLTRVVGAKIVDPEIQVTRIADLWLV